MKGAFQYSLFDLSSQITIWSKGNKGDQEKWDQVKQRIPVKRG